MSSVKFQAIVFLEGKTATGVEVPKSVVEQLAAGKRVPVNVTINGYTYRNTIAVYGGAFFLGISAIHRRRAKVKAGDEIEVTLELDKEPREAIVPNDFAVALNGNQAAQQFFNSLSYSSKQGYISSIEAAKTAETRNKRIAKALEGLTAGKSSVLCCTG